MLALIYGRLRGLRIAEKATQCLVSKRLLPSARALLYRDIDLRWPQHSASRADAARAARSMRRDVTERSVLLLRTLTSASFPADLQLGRLELDFSRPQTSKTWLASGLAFTDLSRVLERYDNRISSLFCKIPYVALTPELVRSLLNVPCARPKDVIWLQATSIPADLEGEGLDSEADDDGEEETDDHEERSYHEEENGDEVQPYDTVLSLRNRANSDGKLDVHVIGSWSQLWPGTGWINVAGDISLVSAITTTLRDAIVAFRLHYQSGHDYDLSVLPAGAAASTLSITSRASRAPLREEFQQIWCELAVKRLELEVLRFTIETPCSPNDALQPLLAVLASSALGCPIRAKRLIVHWDLGMGQWPGWDDQEPGLLEEEGMALVKLENFFKFHGDAGWSATAHTLSRYGIDAELSVTYPDTQTLHLSAADEVELALSVSHHGSDSEREE